MKIKSSPVRPISSKKKNVLLQSKAVKLKTSKPYGRRLNKEKISLAIDEFELINDKKPQRLGSKFNQTTHVMENSKRKTPKILEPNVTASKNKKSSRPKDFNKYRSQSDKNEVKPNQSEEKVHKTQLNINKVTDAVAALLKVMKQKTTSLLALSDPIYMELECIKIPILCSTKQLRFRLPHPLVGELSDVLLITADKKGAKIYPDKAVDYYSELLAKHDINFIHKVLPLRTLKTEYTQYELRRKLVDQYDMILADARIIKSLPACLGKCILYKSKMPIAVHLDSKDLKNHLLRNISKTQMTVRGTGHKTIVKVGNTGMADFEVAKNILAVAEGLKTNFPGGWKNIRSLAIKTATSIALPVFYSLVSPNSVEVPVEKPENPETVEGELSTQLGVNVVVSADGSVYTKKIEEKESRLDASKDDEILEEIRKYKQSRQTVRDDEDSDRDEDAVTAAMERKIVENYNSSKMNKEEDEEGEDEEEGEESSDEEEEPIAPIVGQKRKKEQKKKQELAVSPNKKQKNVLQQGKLKEKKNKETENSTQMTKATQRRGSRGGKKNKLNKHQRKGMLKKKAGKK